mgnify:CR=1 FL=1
MTLLSGYLIDQKLTGISFHPENPTIFTNPNKPQNKVRKSKELKKTNGIE